jgi:hypothetical protein
VVLVPLGPVDASTGYSFSFFNYKIAEKFRYSEVVKVYKSLKEHKPIRFRLIISKTTQLNHRN